MATTKELDITKTGPLNYMQLQLANSGLSPEDVEKQNQTYKDMGFNFNSISSYDPIRNFEGDIQTSLAGTSKPFGSSKYDPKNLTEDELSRIGDIRAENQPGLVKIANGLAKGAMLAGTTFLDGTVGIAVGLGTAISEGRFSGLWDNDFSKAMQSINEQSEEWLPNYYTQREQESPWYENIFSANFIGDKFIKNLGFTVGAFYSGNVWAKGIQATKLPQLVGNLGMRGATQAVAAAKETGDAVKLGEAIARVGRAVDAPAHVVSGVGAVLSAVNEGRIEALNNSKDWYNLEKMKIDDYYSPLFEQLNTEYEQTKGNLVAVQGLDGKVDYIDPAYDRYTKKTAELRKNYEESLAKLNEDRLKMGNMDLLMNIPILTASNIIQFGRLYGNGYKTARKGVNIVNKGRFADMSLTDAMAVAEKEGMAIDQFAKEFAQFGAKEAKKGVIGTLGRFGRNTLTTAVPEGLEEIFQKAASTISGDYYSADVHNFYKLKTDPTASEETLSWMKAFAQGINETVNEGSSWEEFFIGALTGALGMPVFGKANTSSSDTYLGRNKRVGLRGGIIGESREARATRQREENVANYINSRILSPEFKNYYQGLVRHQATQNQMNEAALTGDEFLYKNAEQAQLVSDIMMFDNAGRIGDLITLINSAYDVSPENLESIIKNTTSVQTVAGKEQLVGPFAEYAMLDSSGKIVSNFGSNERQQEMADKLSKNRDEILKAVSDYQLAKDEIDILTGQKLSDEQLQELTWLKVQSKNWNDRGVSIAKDRVRSVLTSLAEDSIIASESMDSAVKKLEEIENTEELRKRLSKEKEGVDSAKSLFDNLLGLKDQGLFYILGNESSSGIRNLLKKVAEASPLISPTDANNFKTGLDDMGKLIDGINSFNTKLDEYLKNPEQQKSELANEDTKRAQTDINNKRNAITRRINFNAPSSEIAKVLAENKDDIDAMGGMEEFMKTLDTSQKTKIKKAQRFAKGLTSLRDSIDSSDLTDEQKRIANKLIDDNVDKVDNISELGNKISNALDNGAVREELANSMSLSDSVDDLAFETNLTDIEGKLKEIFEDKIESIADALSNMEKADTEKLRKAAEAARKKEEGEPEGVPDDKGKPTPKRVPKDSEPTFVPEPSDKTNGSSSAEVKKFNGPKAPKKGTGDPQYFTRPQVSQYYMQGRNGMTYISYLEEALAHPDEAAYKDAFPKGVDKQAYLKYIKATWNYLNDHNAFTYVSGVNKEDRLKPNDTIIFKVDEKLNEDAGVSVVLMVTESGQVIGSLPTSLDFQAINREHNKPEGEIRVGQKALYEEVIKRSKARTGTPVRDLLKSTRFEEFWKPNTSDFDTLIHDIERSHNGKVTSTGNRVQHLFSAVRIASQLGLISPIVESEFFTTDEKTAAYQDKLISAVEELRKLGVNSLSELWDYLQKLAAEEAENAPITTKISGLMGGKIEFGEEEFTIAQTFGDTVPIIAVLNDSSNLFTGDSGIDARLIRPNVLGDSKVAPWSIFAMVPANNGNYLPALCYSTKLSDIIDDVNDWYINQTIEAIQRIPRRISELKDNIKAVYKWIPIPGLSIDIGSKRPDGTWRKELLDVSNAKFVRITYSRPGKSSGTPQEKYIPIVDGEISEADVRSKLQEIVRNDYPNMTTNVDIKKLTNRPEHQEYRKNIANYLHANILSGKSHTVNDWFTYAPTDVEQQVLAKDNDKKDKNKPKTKKDSTTQEVTIDGVTYYVTGNIVENADGDVIPNYEEIAKRVRAALSKPETDNPIQNPGQKPNAAFVAFGSVPKIGSREEALKRSRRRSQGKNLSVSDTEDSTAPQEKIYENIERVKQMFPNLSDANRIIVVNGLIKTVDEEGNPIEAYGQFRDGILYISNQSPLGTAYHEAFHYVTDMLLSDNDRATMFEEARTRYGEFSDIELEEKLAEDFRDYMNGYEDRSLLGKIKTFFRNLRQIIRELSGRASYLDTLFFNIYRNKYSQREERFGTYEEQRILALAPRDSKGRLLAPNGKPSNLNERQYAQVRTKAFKDWFGDWENDPSNASKVVDENGEPLVVYHGNRTDTPITSFDKEKIGSQHKKIIDGFWFISDERIAKYDYAVKVSSFGKGEEGLKFGEVLPVFLNIKSPVIETQKGLKEIDSPYGKMTLSTETLVEFIERIQKTSKNNDGYILTLKDSDSTLDPFYESKQQQFIVRDPNQIKSATDNTGRFSAQNDNFYDTLVKYKDTQLSYDNLNKETQEALVAKGVNKRDYENLNNEDKESITFCLL